MIDALNMHAQIIISYISTCIIYIIMYGTDMSLDYELRAGMSV